MNPNKSVIAAVTPPIATKTQSDLSIIPSEDPPPAGRVGNCVCRAVEVLLVGLGVGLAARALLLALLEIEAAKTPKVTPAAARSVAETVMIVVTVVVVDCMVG